MSYLTSETLIDSVIRRAHIPESQVTFLDDDFLALANEEMQIGILPSMMKFHQEFFVYTSYVNLVVNQSIYPMPDRAVGMKLREIYYMDTQGNLREMARIEPEDVIYYQNRTTVNYPRTFYIENGNIVLVPEVLQGITGQLIMKYYLQPNQLVTSDNIATVQSIDFVGGTIQFDQVPSNITTTTPIDFLQTARGHTTYAIDVMPSTVNYTLASMTFVPDTIPPDLVVGDRVALATTTNIPQIPDELHSLLAQRVVCRCLEAQQDFTGLQQANQKLQEMEVAIGSLIDNRAEGTPQKINNLRGTLRAGKLTRRRSTV